jgi:DNA-binding protein
MAREQYLVSFLPKSLKGQRKLVYFAMSDENVVYIGSKPVMNYCLAVMSSLQDNGSTVALKARGRAISTAVDVAEVTRTRFMQDLKVENIEIGTEELESAEGQKRNVSTITIVLKKG